VASQNVHWLEVPINPAKSRSFKVRARVSSTYAATTTSIPVFVYILDGDGNVDCLSTLADFQVCRGERPRCCYQWTCPCRQFLSPCFSP
jgi:hypothetical protein